ncbi:MAG: alpha/beta fold hydrolase, partial [Planctomycetes bacterium]|nr:alpha/beta fold hydrolase [Planctomycetota bacterium]
MAAKLTHKDRGYDRTLLLVPGWGFDERIFERLSLPYNYLFYPGCDIAELEEAVLAGGHEAMDMLGWSQGGVALAGLACRHPDLVRQLILVSVRAAYPSETLDEIRSLLTRSHTTYLKCFYKACLGQADLPWFKQTLQKDYLAKFMLVDLISGLDWLGQVRLDVAALKDIASVTLVHGAEDQVAPVQEARTLAAQLPQARYCEVSEAAHAVFLNSTFSEIVTVVQSDGGTVGQWERKM